MHDSQQANPCCSLTLITAAFFCRNVDPDMDSSWIENLSGGSFCLPNDLAAVRCPVLIHGPILTFCHVATFF